MGTTLLEMVIDPALPVLPWVAAIGVYLDVGAVMWRGGEGVDVDVGRAADRWSDGAAHDLDVDVEGRRAGVELQRLRGAAGDPARGVRCGQDEGRVVVARAGLQDERAGAGAQQ